MNCAILHLAVHKINKNMYWAELPTTSKLLSSTHSRCVGDWCRGVVFGEGGKRAKQAEQVVDGRTAEQSLKRLMEESSVKVKNKIEHPTD